jgi:hypothetical protein
LIRRFLPATALLALALVACGAPKAPAITDPNVIITRGMEATGQASSFHVDVQLSGRITPQQGGASFNLDQTTAAGDFDVTHRLGRVTFDAPGLFGLSGEVIQIGADSYVKTKLTGEKYAKSTSADTNPAADPDQIFSEVSGFLDKDGVQTAKLDDVSCGDGTCYHVTLSVPASLLSGTAGSNVDLGQLADTVVLDLQFDQQTLRLVQLSTDIDANEAGTASVLVILSRYEQAVEVSPPPSELVTEGGGFGF